MATQEPTPKSPSSLPSLPTSSAPIATPNTINIGTRRSHLARVQTDIVVSLLKEAWPHHNYQVHAISTMGDKNQVTSLNDFGAKGLWTHELEAMLLKGEVDFIVHSLKDMPTQLPHACILGAVLPRGDPRDALILHPNHASQNPPPTLATLPAGSLIGGAVRRAAQLSRLYPHLKFEGVRGNVQTRLDKLDAPDSRFAGIVLAAAGLKRVELGHRISGYLESRNVEGAAGTGHVGHGHLSQRPGGQALHPSHAVLHLSQRTNELSTTAGSGRDEVSGTMEQNADTDTADDNNTNANSVEAQQTRLGDRRWGMLHAVGQGALGIEARLGDTRVAELLKPLICRRTTMACLAERSLMRTLEGGCSVPIGVETEWADSVFIDGHVEDESESKNKSSDPAEKGRSAIGAMDARLAAGTGTLTSANERSERSRSNQADGTTTPTSAPPGSTKNVPPTNISESQDLTMRAIVVSLDGTDAAEAEVTRRITDKHEAEEFGIEVAALLTKRGADRILASINLDRGIIVGQGGA